MAGFFSWRSIGEVTANAVDTVADLVYPRQCATCSVVIEGHQRHLCADCQRKMDLLMAAPACWRCGHSIGPFGLDENGRCMACRESKPPLDGLARAGAYVDPISTLVRVFKYAGHDELDLMCAEAMVATLELAPWLEQVEAFVCVPTHWRHSIRRAFYAPASLTNQLSRMMGIPTAVVLRRVTGGPHQMDLPRSKRAANIKGKFAIARGALVNGARLCLVDDVSTTGATLNECARVLKAAGAEAVYGVVLGKVNTAFEK